MFNIVKVRLELMTRLIIWLSIVFILSACDFKFSHYDEDKAVKQASKILIEMLFNAEAKSVYFNSSAEFKRTISYSDFELVVESLSYNFPHDAVQINGYEVHGSTGLITVHASSFVFKKYVYFALTFDKNEKSEYELNNFKVNFNEFSKNSAYSKYTTPVQLVSSNTVNRKIILPDGENVIIEGIAKNLLKDEKLFIYTVTYRTDIDLSDEAAVEEQAQKVLHNFAAEKALSKGLTTVSMAASNESAFDHPMSFYPVYRTTFEYKDNQWVKW